MLGYIWPKIFSDTRPGNPITGVLIIENHSFWNFMYLLGVWRHQLAWNLNPLDQLDFELSNLHFSEFCQIWGLSVRWQCY
jgi:hypothetical protein